MNWTNFPQEYAECREATTKRTKNAPEEAYNAIRQKEPENAQVVYELFLR